MASSHLDYHQRMNTRIGFIGLGVMGLPMAGHLGRAGYPLVVLDADATRVEALLNEHPSAVVARQPAELAGQSDVVFTMLPDGKQVNAVACGRGGLVDGFSGGELLIDTSSSEPWLTLDTAKDLAGKGVALVDAPTSGAEAGAIAASLVFMAGGSERNLARAREILAG